MDTFSSAPTSPRMCSTQLVRDDYQFQFVSVAICFISFGAHMNILSKRRFLSSLTCHLGPPSYVDH